ncbi:DUF1775 domain-containing protein [Streptomyces apricus]|uniref:DUF1775 domain-containing protein n=1 Tax=Streptomyces apricus TaxID=1828112 RepID=A0A5A9ZW70_9ACTN|nr:DUF1775 domain-containing protein [Streptomyces apricus]KAA0921547.1 DUF1775 domain-containing protein [Streptomyces apricus]
MHRPIPPRGPRRTGVLAAAVLALALSVATAGPASAHAEVEAKGARALDRNVELTFSAESESGSAGITRLEVVLPEGIRPGDITYEEGPDGWKLVPADQGYAVSGPELPVGEDAEYVVTVRQLPDAESLVFKTLQSYGDGEVDRWIELEDTGGDGHGHGHPAPRLALKPAAPGAKPVSPGPDPSPSADPATDAPPSGKQETRAAAQPAADGAEKDDGTSLAVPVGAALVVLLLGGGGAWWLRRRRNGSA